MGESFCGGEGGYLDEFKQLSANDFYMDATKIQVTYPGEGFHQWHYDNSGFLVQGRGVCYYYILE